MPLPIASGATAAPPPNASPPASHTTPAAPSAGRSSAASRAAALKAKLETEPAPAETDPSAPPTEVGAASAPGGLNVPQTPPAQGASGATAPQGDDAIARARQDRLARIAQVRQKEDAQEVDRERHRGAKARDREVEELRAKLAKLEPMEAVFKNEDALLAAAEERGMSPEKLIQWMRNRLSDPAAVASRQAKTEAEKVREELAAERKKREDLEQRLADERTQAQEAAEGHARAQSFVEQAASKEASHPLTSAFLKRHGATAFVNYANQFVAPLLSKDYDLDQLHDVYEQLLDELQLGGAPAAATANPANGLPSKKNGAGEAGTTLGNALTQERATVSEEIPTHRLPLRERERRLREKLEREGGG